jgi:hypothetical protein
MLQPMKAYKEIIELIAAGTTPRKVVGYRPSGDPRRNTKRRPVWAIPESALDTFEDWPPKIGRPCKPKASTAKHSLQRTAMGESNLRLPWRFTHQIGSATK